MDSQWSSQPYADSSQNRQPRYVDNVLQANAQGSRDYGHHQPSSAQQMPPTMQSYQNQPYQAYQHGSSSSISSPPSARSGGVGGGGGGGDYMDVQMQDADLYNRNKYAQPPRQQPQQQPQQQQASQQQPQQQLPSRQSSYLQSDEAASSQRYSPMNTSQPQYTPTNSQAFGANQPQFTPSSSVYTQGSSTYQSARQSPTRPGYTSSQQSYYSQDSARVSQSGSHPQMQHGGQQQPVQSRNLNTTQHLPPISVQTDPNSSRYYPQPAVLQSNTSFDQPPPPSPQRRPQPEAPFLQRISNGNVEMLGPKINSQPAYRRANPDGGFISPLQALTTFLPSTYRLCNPNFKYESSKNPRRVLTKPSKGVKNDGYDNEDSDYILYVNDTLGSEENGHKNRYLILDVLGQGTFGQVVKCQNLRTQEVVAVKVIKNRTAYFNQSMMEVSVLDLLNSKLDKNDDHHVLRLKDTFIHRQHLCLVFELLSVNLYELIKQNQFRGLSTTLVRVFAQQLLHALALLNKANLIHCDLKPENILLKNLESPMIKVIDFGSACDERQTVYTYIQSRFYRSPEVLLGLPYSCAIDMWSLGCIVVELFLGLPLFPGSSEYNQVSRIVEMLGIPPAWMIEMGKQSGEFFERVEDDYGRKSYRLKSMEQYSREHNTKEQPSKKYFQATTLPEIIRTYAMPRKNMKPIEIEREMNNRVAFIDFCRGLLNLNPLERWSPQQAKLHPFITQQKYTGPFVPPMNLKSNSKPPAPGTLQQQAAQAKHAEQEQKLRAQQAAQMQAQQAAQQQSQSPYGNSSGVYGNQPVYNNMYTPPGGSAAPPQYQQQYPPSQPVLPTQPLHPAHPAHNYPQNGPPPSLYAQAATRNAVSRARASTTMDGSSGVPVQIAKAASLMDPSQPIRLQPSPAYYPPGMDDGVGGRGARYNKNGGKSKANRDLIRNLEGTLEEGGWSSGGGHWNNA